MGAVAESGLLKVGLLKVLGRLPIYVRGPRWAEGVEVVAGRGGDLGPAEHLPRERVSDIRKSSRLCRSDFGETLVEINMAIALMGLALLTLVAGLPAAFALSGQRDNQALVTAATRVISEQLVSTKISSCANVGTPGGSTGIEAVFTSISTSLGVTFGARTYSSLTAASVGATANPTPCTTSPTPADSGALLVHFIVYSSGLSPTGTSATFQTPMDVVISP